MTIPSAESLPVQRRLPLFVLGVGVLLTAFRYFSFISNNAVNVLFYDQWDFLNPFFEDRAGLIRLFLLQNGPHREGLGLIADKFLYPLTRWSTRAEGLMIGGFIFAAMLVALRIKQRLFGRLGYADLAIPLMFLSLSQFETFIGTPNPAYSAIPLLLIMLYCWVLIGRRTVLRLAWLLLLNFLLIYTGMGIFMGIVTIAVFTLECYWGIRQPREIRLVVAVAGLGVAVASLASFFVNYQFRPAVPCFVFPDPNPSEYPKFAAVMLTSFFGVTTPLYAMTVAGLFPLVAAIAILAAAAYKLTRRGSTENVDFAVSVLLLYGLLFCGNATIGRVCLGRGAAMASRYATPLVPIFLAMYLYLCSYRLRFPSLRFQTIQKVATAAFVIMLTPGALRYPPGARWFVLGKRAWVACYLRAGSVAACDQETGFRVYPNPVRTDLDRKLNYLKERKLSLFANSAVEEQRAPVPK